MPSSIYWLNKDSRTFLSRDYLLPGTTAEQRMRFISDYAEKLFGDYPGFADKFETYLHRGWYSPSSPVWSNFGTDRGLSISCNGSYIGDSVNEITDKIAEIAIMTKHGAGTSGYFGDVRPRGAPISKGGVSMGSVHFMQWFNSTISVISQSTVRRGQFAAYLPIDHPDFLEFLNIRQEGNPIQELLIGACISDDWMKSLIAKDKQKLTIWKKLLERRRKGLPYLFFTDTVNRNAPQVYKDKGMKIHASNLCVAPETQLLTKTGYEVIQDLVDQEVEVWNGKEWSTTTVHKTGSDQKLLRVVLSNGSEISATDYHKWYTVASYLDQRLGNETPKRTFELKPGDKLCKFDLPLVNGSDDISHPYTNGAFSADGFVYEGCNRIWLYGEKHKLAPFLDGEPVGEYSQTLGRSHMRLPDDLAPKFHVPINASTACKLRWLEGFFDFDGCILNVPYKGEDNQSLQAGSIHKQFLEEIKYLLQTVGVHSKVVHAADEGDRMMPDGHGGMKLFHCQQAYRILVSSIGLFRLMNLGFAPNRLEVKNRKPQRDAMQFVKVVEVIDDNRTDDTYCCTEPLRGRIVINGVMTGNCNEIALSSSPSESFVCDLSSLNLLHYHEWKDTDAVEVLTYFLDAVMTDYIRQVKDIPHMEAAHRFAVNQRALGIGVLGWHSLLQRNSIPFESMQAKLLNTEIFKLIQQKSHAASREMAVRYGEPPLLKGYGLRNVTTMAVAPTKSSSFILGQVSAGIEPIDSNYSVANLQKGTFSYRNPELQKVLAAHGKDSETTWRSILVKGGSVQHLVFLTDHEREVFKTFSEISPKEVLIQAGTRQRYIDQSQSLNLMIPASVSDKQLSDLLVFAWESGVKGLYYQHSSNPSQELVRSLMTTCKSCEG